MTIRELIHALLDQDPDAEIAIKAAAPYYEDARHVEGAAKHPNAPSIVLLMPELPLTQTSATHD